MKITETSVIRGSSIKEFKSWWRKQDWGTYENCYKIKKKFILSPCLFNLYVEYIMRNAGLEEAQAGIKIARKNVNNLRYADDTTLMAESEEELKSPD